MITHVTAAAAASSSSAAAAAALIDKRWRTHLSLERLRDRLDLSFLCRLDLPSLLGLRERERERRPMLNSQQPDEQMAEGTAPARRPQGSRGARVSPTVNRRFGPLNLSGNPVTQD